MAGCGEDGASSADKASDLYSQGLVDLYQAVEGANTDGAPWEWGVDVDDAMAKFDEALGHDPDHCGALLGSALTHVLSVLSNPQLREILGELFPAERGAGGRSLFWYAQTPDVLAMSAALEGRSSDFHFSGLQSYLEETALPEFALADARLARFEDLSCAVNLTIVLPDSQSMRPDERDKILVLNLDVTDAYFAHAALDALRAVSHALAAYDLDRDSGQTLQHLIEDDEDFLTLRAGGHTQLAYEEAGALAAHLIEAASSLEGETDPQENDLITETGGLVELDEILDGPSVELLTELGEDVQTALTDGMQLALTDIDPAAPSLSLLIDVDEMLNDPLVDLRTYLPAHTWPSPDSMSIQRPVSMPDPTLDGITPDLTQEEWDEVVSWLLGRGGR